MSSEEVAGDGHVPDLLVDVERRVAGVVDHDLVRVLARRQLVHVCHRLSVRAA
jgi:hypothetical protein